MKFSGKEASKSLLVTALLALSLAAPAQTNDCSFMGRATTTDQKSMAYDIAFKYLGLQGSQVIRMQTSDYVSWKSMQVQCLANIIHYARVSVESRDGQGRRCLTELDLHTKDYFVAQLEYNREYKARNVETTCFKEDAEQSQQRLQCDQMPKCPTKRDGLQVRDLYNNCECSYVLDLVDYEEVSEDYEDFYNPNRPFKKPEGLQSPFN